MTHLVIRRRSRKLGEPRLLGIEGDLGLLCDLLEPALTPLALLWPRESLDPLLRRLLSKNKTVFVIICGGNIFRAATMFQSIDLFNARRLLH